MRLPRGSWELLGGGYSIHKTIDAAAKYLKDTFESSERLHRDSPAKYWSPEPGWHRPIIVTPVWLPFNRMVAKAIGSADSFSVYRMRGVKGGDFYKKVEALEVAGPSQTININSLFEDATPHTLITSAPRRSLRPISFLLGLKK